MAQFALFTSTYAPEPIGSAVYMADFARELVQRGHPTTVICCYPYYPDWDRSRRKWRFQATVEDGVRVIRVPHTVPSRPNALGRLGIEATYGISSALATLRLPHFDAAIGAVPALSGGLGAWWAGAVRRKPFGLMVRDLVSAAALYGGVPGSGPRVARGVRAVEAFLAPRAARVSVIARGFVEPMQEMGARHVDYLPNYRTVGEPSMSREEARRRFQVSEDAFVAVYSGAIGFKQGILGLVDAALQAPGAFFLVAGEGSQRSALLEAVQRAGVTNVRWIPLVPDEDYADLLGTADAFLMPQAETGVDMSVPGKLTSYIAMARPVVAAASPHSETARIVRESGSGIVVPPSDPGAIAAALNELIAAPHAAAEFSASARRYADDVLDRQRGVDRFIEWALALAERRDPVALAPVG